MGIFAYEAASLAYLVERIHVRLVDICHRPDFDIGPDDPLLERLTSPDNVGPARQSE